MPVYNAEEFLPETIDSIVNQTYSNWQLVSVVDGARDNSLGVLEAYRKQYPEKIKIINRKENRGTVYTLNEAMNNVDGDYVCWLSADDLYEIDMIESSFIEISKDDSLDFVFSRSIQIDEKGNFIGEDNRNSFWKEIDKESKTEIYRNLLLFGNAFNFCTLFGKTKAYTSGCFDSKYKYAHDYEYAARLASGYNIKGFNKVNTRNREHANQVTRLGNNECDAIDVWFSLLLDEEVFRNLAIKSGYGVEEAYIESIKLRVKLYALADKELQRIKEYISNDAYLDIAERYKCRAELERLQSYIDLLIHSDNDYEPFFIDNSERGYLNGIVDCAGADGIVINKQAVRFDRYFDKLPRERLVRGLERNNNLYCVIIDRTRLNTIIKEHGEELRYCLLNDNKDELTVVVTAYMLNDQKMSEWFGGCEKLPLNKTIWDCCMEALFTESRKRDRK